MYKDTDLWVVAEALDAIFDVFGEDHLNPVIKEIELIEKLKSVAPALKSKVNFHIAPRKYKEIQKNFSGSNTDGLFATAVSNLSLSP